jgi:GTP-binding protein HflX
MPNWNPNKQGKFRNSIGDETAKRPSPQERYPEGEPNTLKRQSNKVRNTFSTLPVQEKAILVSVCTSQQTMERTEEYLNELEFLLETAGGVTLKKVIQRLERPDTRTYVGSGKLEEIKEYKQALEVDFIVFDDELSPAQLRNLEKELECRILDRTTLILDIFAKRARTSIAKTQVELAQLQYMLPRLTRLWTHLERQRGGIGMRGPGETQIETDRRLIKERISALKLQLAKFDTQKTLQRKNRESLVRVALVGYTNVGKSTLMNLLSKSDVFAENKLFATLDTTVRKMVIGNLPFLLTDTVGFIRKLPTQLVESFKSTLDEVVEADLLLHVVDISHPDHEEQIAAVGRTLEEIGAADKPTIMVFNKIDAYTYIEKDADDLSPVTRANWTLEMLEESWMGKQGKCIFISAAEKSNIDALRDMLYEEVRRIHAVRYPYNNFLY